MFKILFIITGLYTGLPFTGEIVSDPIYLTEQECIMAISSDGVKSDVSKIINNLKGRGFSELKAELKGCVSEEHA